MLLNLLALASAQGWLGTPSARGEPERLSNQLNPERIVLHAPEEPGITAQTQAPPPAPPPAPALPPSPAPAEQPGPPTDATPDASAAVAAAPLSPPKLAVPQACVAYSGMAESQADALIASVQSAQPDLDVRRSTTSTPTAWWVRIPAEGGREGAERRIEELRALGVTEYFIVQEPGPNRFAVSLGLFKTEAKAQQHFAFLRSKGVREAGVAPRTATVHRIEFRGPAAALATLGKSRAVARAGATRSECTP
ncbi:MAG: SPOR domain-containing protein [Aromatoleum sp.]|uniref:SPOR domain-containing protein n=1 Tax=Aromatoleum sp. TaxID=2307007 RepID=UPI0028956833|nr:SPOR domain-containing protein [Aromatoleum sp.]MDT3670914.1 SPOR domain-containing protein [Aromatoleum sp.]